MNRFQAAAIMLAAALFASCSGQPDRLIVNQDEATSDAESAMIFTIVDYKNKALGASIPEWVNLWLEGGVHEVEAMNAHKDRYVFISRNEGGSINALNYWKDGFTPQQDFPRMAAARVEARFSHNVPLPDKEYGAYYETLVRALSDTPWTGALREDDFWMLKRFPPAEDGSESETWEFLILLTIGKSQFTSQLNAIFDKIEVEPPPSKDQNAAINRAKASLFDGF